jgi:hypothetical protein
LDDADDDADDDDDEDSDWKMCDDQMEEVEKEDTNCDEDEGDDDIEMGDERANGSRVATSANKRSPI